MRILIADSGATKTSWASLSGTDIQVIETQGLNPVLKADSEIESIIFEELLPQLATKVFDQVRFYGAGCKALKHANRLKHYLEEAFSKTEIFIKTDIEGAGIALFGDEEGIIVISGTGSSAGFMNNGKLIDSMPSKAYPEGDFGSGCYIGALILDDYFKNETPDFIGEIIDMHITSSYDALFVQFQDPKESKQIAAKIMRHIGNFKDTAYVLDKARASIEMLLKELQNHFGEELHKLSIKLIGSTAFYFEDAFRNIFAEEGVEIIEVKQNPIQGLIHYYTKNL